MNYFASVKKVDNVLIALLSLGVVVIFLLSIIGEFQPKDTPNVSKACGTENLLQRINNLLKSKPRFIAVVGDGVPSESIVMERPYNTQFAQGYDLYQGVHHAIESMADKKILDSVGVLYIDDGGNPNCAGKIAQILADEPRLLGVIGHSTTSCSKEAIFFYKSHNIPLIIPAATNPELLYDRPKNCFRLPSNDEIQSLVITDLIINKFKAVNVFVVWDATNEAAQYSEFIKNTVQHFLSKSKNDSLIIEGSYPISLNPLNYSYLFRRIVSSQPDAVVFAGYGSLAREFLLGLDSEYSQYKKINRPKIILTDGCKIPGIKGYGFDTYVTFASDRLNSFPRFANFDPGARMSRFQKMYLEESFEVFGYDAVTIMLAAINSLRSSEQNISRAGVINTIAQSTRAFQTCYTYRFEGGENMNHRYYCYSLGKDSVAYSYEENEVNQIVRWINE